ncbi:hypothetical protein QBC33DRAFT_617537 [Phialemonium atrogriseum]|uniref:ORC1/DEAH AAA+ ATPase domain-containing protein n=1 Tax=Phialemonium atrogriseum TaxID=1093897 RepID=A0AAJ0C772_9PEZI|nr:uncharacterized protein QBC33DRAFT_617537 [Phialemonium atrogriseum]KAK1770253.1 hypothetical protein QBC33DRAFT_617537 [Phialemonium atrogriseum]
MTIDDFLRACPEIVVLAIPVAVLMGSTGLPVAIRVARKLWTRMQVQFLIEATNLDRNALKACRVIQGRNENVIDRPDIFAQLEILLPPKSEYQSAALCGLGGSGKTQVALEYGHRRCRDPACSVFWVHADNETTFAQDYKTIARKLGLADNLDGKELLVAVRERIEADPCWVVIFDNADDLALFGVGQTSHDTSGGQVEESTGKPASLYDYIPQGATGTVLWTSRDGRIVGTLVGAPRGIRVGPMCGDEAMALLETSRNEKISSEEVGDAGKLLEKLQWLPLAISQAGAYLRRTSMMITEYLSRLEEEKERWRVLEATEFDRHRRPNVPNSILETWSISIERIRLGNEMAYKILHIIAYVNNQNIPFEILAAAGMFGDEVPKGESWEDKDRVVEAATRLKEFSFLELNRGEGGVQSYEMHKLVQEATRYRLSGSKSEGGIYFANGAIQIMAKLFPKPKQETWAECEKYIAHAEQVGEWAEICKKEVEVSDLLTQVSRYLFECGRWREKEPVDKRAYELRKQVLGGNDLRTIWSMASLAITYLEQRKFDEAEKINVEALLRLRQEGLGNEHDETILIMVSLAATYQGQGRCDEAENIYMEALGLLQVLGDKHHETMETMALLAIVYNAQGRYDEAERILVEALRLWREILGDNHLDTIASMGLLAMTYHRQGRYDEAERIQVDVLRLRRKVLGDNHLDTIASMGLLAMIYHRQGRYDEAERIQVDVLRLRREVLGNKHPDSLHAMSDLAVTWKSQGRRDDALAMLEECLQLTRSVLGPDHPEAKV